MSDVGRPLVTTVDHDFGELRGVRSRARDWLAAIGAPDAVSDDIVLALDEAVANALEHSTPSSGPTARRIVPVEIRLSLHAGMVEVRVHDSGTWTDRAGESRNRGRGIGLMGSVMDSCEIVRDDAGTTVTMTRRVADPADRPTDARRRSGFGDEVSEPGQFEDAANDL